MTLTFLYFTCIGVTEWVFLYNLGFYSDYYYF